MYEFTKTKDNVDIISKWFENSPYGISFKIKTTNSTNIDKFTAINIDEFGKVIYKTQWKEEDNGNINDIVNTYNYVKELVSLINLTLINHPKKMSIVIPQDWEFRFAFINCIQKFKLPDNKIIDHNDLSEFCRFFYPYVVMVIEPSKRTAKDSLVNEKSKYGSYLRYKRVSKFNNQNKIEQRILSYMRNFNLDDDSLIDVISKQFNITTEKAKDDILKVRSLFGNISKGRKQKKQDNLPKFKPPGIGIAIQGKTVDKYKIIISGARDQKQLEHIITFLNILIYLYAETYINKNPLTQKIKEKLHKLTNIAKRRNKVDNIVNYQKEIKTIKQMTQSDKKRLGFTPEEGHNQWSRSCQNSGNDKRRRPRQTVIQNVNQLLERGYTLNKKTMEYEKKVIIKKKGKRESEITLKALKVENKDGDDLTNEILYTCEPEENGEHMYVGFLTKSNNPFNECMPCCFKKNPLITKKQDKQDFYKSCMNIETTQQVHNTTTGDILYILQDTNKIQDGRIGYLPQYIDIITNSQLKKTKEIKNNHYLLKTDSYFFKYGINQENYSFITSLSSVLNITVDEIKDIIINFFNKDKDELYYTSLNDGDIRAKFRIGDFLTFIKNESHIDYYYLKDIIKIKGLFTKNGIFPIVLNKNQTIIKKGIEKEKMLRLFGLVYEKQQNYDQAITYYTDGIIRSMSETAIKKLQSDIQRCMLKKKF
jgi:hypothetical protein